MPGYNYTAKRLYVDVPIKGEAIELDRAQSNYLLNVLRLPPQSIILIFDGENGEWEAELISHKRKSAQLLPIKKIREQTPKSTLHYCFAPIKSGRMDYTIQKAVEMGAGTIQPVITEYTHRHKISVEKELARMSANAIEAAEQCGILNIPICKPAIKLEDLLQNWQTSMPLIFCDESAKTTNPLEILANPLDTANRKTKGFGVLIGPEGGFSPNERETLYGLNYVKAIPLGPRILRADTAAVAALAILQATIGDWH